MKPSGWISGEWVLALRAYPNNSESRYSTVLYKSPARLRLRCPSFDGA
jgi:hypothetical protein